jgi:hypothetical protein
VNRLRRDTLVRLTMLGGAAVIASKLPTLSARPRSDSVNPKDFGAIADGVSHPLSSRYTTLAAAQSVYPFATTLEHEVDWCAIQAAINTGSPVKLPAGKFRITETLTMIGMSVIRGAGPATVLTWARPNRTSVFAMFAAAGTSGIRLGNFAVRDDTGSTGGYVFIGNNVLNVVVDQLIVKGMAIAMFDASHEASKNYSRVVIDTADPKFNGCADVHVKRCAATCIATSPDPRAATLFRYCVGWSVTRCRFSDTPFGVQWWGGDSNPGRDGSLTSRRKCTHGTVTDVEVVNCVAGIWGSMGADVKVVGCDVDTATDVGIDFEGCLNCVASENHVQNCVNGNLTIFWWNDNVEFVENTSRQKIPLHPHLRVYNASQTINNHSLLVKGNKFVTEGAIGVIDTKSGCVERLDFLNNDLHDTKIDFVANNLRYVNVTDNMVSFSRAAAEVFDAIEIGQLHDGGHALVARNIVNSQVKQPKGSSAIYLWSDDYNTDIKFEVIDNGTAGFPIDLTTNNKGENLHKTSYFTIEGNAFTAGAYRKEEHGAKGSICFLRANRGIPDKTGGCG